MRRLIAFLALVLFAGCGSNPIKFKEQPCYSEHCLHAPGAIKRAASNKYCIVIKGNNSIFDGDRCGVDELDAKSKEVQDRFIDSDITETENLAFQKNYEVYVARSDGELETLIDAIIKLSNDHTQLLVAMSGECDAKGFIINLVHTSGGMNLVPPGKKLLAEKIIAHLSMVRGVSAVVVSGCQSGCFVEAARKDPEFKGVVIAACSVGYATTQCERTGTSALYAAFLGLYRDDPTTVKNLATVQLSPGFWFENFRHKVSDIGAGGLPISYDAVIYSTSEFLF